MSLRSSPKCGSRQSSTTAVDWLSCPNLSAPRRTRSTGRGHSEPHQARSYDAVPTRPQIEVENTADVPISVTSHFHFFEVNPRLRFDRAVAYGMRLADRRW